MNDMSDAPENPPRVSESGRVLTATCSVCSGVIGWIDCPTGGWWAHEQHPADEHDAEPTAGRVLTGPMSERMAPPPYWLWRLTRWIKK